MPGRNRGHANGTPTGVRHGRYPPGGRLRPPLPDGRPPFAMGIGVGCGVGHTDPAVPGYRMRDSLTAGWIS